jgi:hypothetical protein
MADPKEKTVRREAGKSKFRLPERPPRLVETNPLREILQEAKAQEEALARRASGESVVARPHTPATGIAGVSATKVLRTTRALPDTPAINSAGVVSPFLPSSDSTKKSAKSFAEFSKRWVPILRSGQMSVCRALFEMTYALGQAECFSSIPKVAAVAGLKERQCYNVIAQLEQLGFIERPEIFNTSNKKGTIFRLHLSPQLPDQGTIRHYHIGGDNND